MSDLMKVGEDFGGSGTFKPFTADVTGAQRASNAHAFYFDPVTRRRAFNGAIVGQVTTVGLNTTYTGLCLSNPIGSVTNIVVTKVGVSFIVAFAAGAHVGLMTGFHAGTDVVHTTPVIARCQYISGTQATGVAKLDSAATLPIAPTVNTILGSGLTGAITTAPAVMTNFDMDGSIVLAPGGFCAFYTSTASAAAASAFSFTWEELPLLV